MRGRFERGDWCARPLSRALRPGPAQWAFMVMTNAGEPRAHYQRRKTYGAALQHVFNRIFAPAPPLPANSQTYIPIKAFRRSRQLHQQTAA
jgi:hypothetical protein